MRNKGKVYPSSSTTTQDSLSILNLLPSTILTLTIVLSLEDQHVLAYMITLNTKKKTSKTHTTPLFDCDCFECYTSYWFKWDSSPNRQLIHQAIEAYEESLTSFGKLSKKKPKKKGHRSFAGKNVFPVEEKGLQDLPKGQMGQCQFSGKSIIPIPEVMGVQEIGHHSLTGKDIFPAPEEKGLQVFQRGQMGQSQFAGKSFTPVPEVKGVQEIGHRSFSGKDIFPAPEEKGLQDSPKGQMGQCHFAGKKCTQVPEEKDNVGEEVVLAAGVSPEMRAPAMSQHNKGLARKVLPDVIGLFNWRLWSLWSPNV